MRALPFNPYLAQRRCLWRNRVSYWRQAPGEATFHAVIWLALAAMLGTAAVSLSSRELAEAALALIRSAPLAWLSGWEALLAMQVRSRLHDWQRRDAFGWLAAQPVTAGVRRRERQRVVLNCVVWHALGGALLLLFLRAPWVVWGWLALGLTGASVAGAFWAMRDRSAAGRAAQMQVDDHRESSRHFAGPGCLWRWQVREALAGISPRALRHGLWMLLLIPVGAGTFAAGLALAIGLVLAACLAAWRRSLEVLVQAERWLGTQPARAGFWWSGLGLPLALAALGAVAVGFAVAVLGAERVAPWIGFALFALAMLQALCALALRRTPGRIALAFALHLALLGAVWQTFPPLLVPLWLGVCLRLVRRGMRP